MKRQAGMRTFVVGDVHGQAEMLRELLPLLRARAAPGDTLVFVGDYIDRGPDSRGVIDLVLAERRGGWPGPVAALKGNHEELMLDYLSEQPRFEPGVWMQNGGIQTVASYTEDDWHVQWETAIPREHLRFLEGLASWYEDENGIYVHAGLPPGIGPEEATDDDRLWIREPFIKSDYRWPKVVVFGHTPQYEPGLASFFNFGRMKWRPLDRPEKIGIDTGAAYGGPLTAVILPEREFISVAPRG
jgi:serine/threonine protein phosphatase 1